MAAFWRNISRGGARANYDLNRLVDCRERWEFPPAKSAVHIICDIDKTYLETKFESLANIVQVAFQSAEDKQTVQGATQVLLSCRWPVNGDSSVQLVPRGLHFISSSPPQLRAVLEEKLMLDGLDWNSDTFKNQAYNLLKGRVNLLRQHIPYKTAAILKRVQKMPNGSKLILIGDNAESDAFIYLGVCLYLRRQLSQAGYCEYFRCAGIDEDLIDGFAKNLAGPAAASVEGILIRQAPGYHFDPYSPLTDGMRHFVHFYQAALILCAMDIISSTQLTQLTRQFHNRFGMSRLALAIDLKTAEKSAPTQMVDAIQSCIMQLESMGPLKAKDDPTRTIAPCDFSSLDNLSEDEILAHTRQWLSNKSHALDAQGKDNLLKDRPTK